VSVGCSNSNRQSNGAVGTSGTTANNNVTSGDKDFIHDVAQANMAEIELSRLAAQHASSPEVKRFAQMMIDDHTSAGDKLKAIASANSIDWPTELDRSHRDKLDDLSKKQGADFDKAYMDAMASDHKDFVDKLESRLDKKNMDEWHNRPTGTSGSNREAPPQVVPEKSDNPITMKINEWAASTYPTAFNHRERAKSLDDAAKNEKKEVKKHESKKR
jgi:putative membrane protein